MTECSNSEVRDLLPDYVAEQLPAGDQAMLDGHLVDCASCRDELSLLRVARAVRPHAVDIDVSRIVAALPARAATTPLRLVHDDDRRDGAGEVAASRGMSMLPQQIRRAPMSRVWRIAATLAVTAIGGWTVLTMGGANAPESATGVAVAGARNTPLVTDSAQPAVVVALGETLDVSAGKRAATACKP